MKKLNTVILIDDDEVALSLNETVIRSVNICNDLIIFPNAVQGLNYFKELCGSDQCPELIFLDLKLPVLDGFEFIQEFKSFFSEYSRKVKIVVLTSSNRSQDKEKAASMGVDDFVVKPLTSEKVKTIMTRHFGYYYFQFGPNTFYNSPNRNI